MRWPAVVAAERRPIDTAIERCFTGAVIGRRFTGTAFRLGRLDSANRMASDLALALVLAVAGLASAGLVGLALVALVRRKSWPYLLVVLALATLLARTGVAVGSMTGTIGPTTHHTLEHVLDVAMAGLVIAAVVTARSARRAAGERFAVDVGTRDGRGGEDGD